MCMEDIRIGRRTIHTPRNFALGVASGVIAAYDEKRIQLLIYPPSSGTLTIFPANSVIVNKGITLTSTSHPMIMTVDTHGDLVKKMWAAIHSAGGVTCFVSEGFLDET